MTGFLILAFLILVAMVVSVPLATRFGLGSVLGYLLAGMAIAPLLAALNVDVVALQVFAEFGVVMMLFIIGLEMEPRRLWDMRGKLLGLGGGQVILTTAVITGIALLDARPWQTAVAIGMILALSSTAIIVQSLTEKKLMRTEGGEASFSVLLVQDVAVIPILALLPLLAISMRRVAAPSVQARITELTSPPPCRCGSPPSPASARSPQWWSSASTRSAPCSASLPPPACVNCSPALPCWS